MSPNIITQQQMQYQNNSYSNLRGASGGGGKVNNLDLINGCIDNQYDPHTGKSRQNRSKILYAQNGYNRHETKL